jgi:hypothetical protein
VSGRNAESRVLARSLGTRSLRVSATLRGGSLFAHGRCLANERRIRVTPFAPLSLASAQYQIEDAVGRYAGNRKKDSRPGGGKKPNLRGVLPSPPTDALSPPPSWAAQTFRRIVRLGRSVLNLAPVQAEHAHRDGARRPVDIDGPSVLKLASSTGKLSVTETSILGVSEEG